MGDDGVVEGDGVLSTGEAKRLIPILLIAVVAVAGLLCAAVISPPVFTVCGFAAVSLLLSLIINLLFDIIDNSASNSSESHRAFSMLTEQSFLIIGLAILLPRIVIFLLVLWLLIYKFRRRHLSEYSTIESLLQSDNKLSPIRYSYSEIKKMTRFWTKTR
ncbi:rust resistance kinase Lr10-like isoform X3 [Salvia divinorum]|uniref:Rust resistance kinase Lr10-like isoform X3 n=1 Tax=Salvia divinorum TaxID=28513 RepID=A0ABD1H9I1_SALDI